MTSDKIMTEARDVAANEFEPPRIKAIAAELIRLHDGAAWSSEPPSEPCDAWWRKTMSDKPRTRHVGVWPGDKSLVVGTDFNEERILFGGVATVAQIGGFWLRAETADAAVVAELRRENERLRASWELAADTKVIDAKPNELLIETRTGDRRRISMANPEEFDRMQAELAEIKNLLNLPGVTDKMTARETAEHFVKVMDSLESGLNELLEKRTAELAEVRKEVERLKETNSNLNRRCQKAESNDAVTNAYTQGLRDGRSDIRSETMEKKECKRLNQIAQKHGERAAKLERELSACQRRLADAERAFDKRLAEVTAERDSVLLGCPWENNLDTTICPVHKCPIRECPLTHTTIGKRS